MLRASVLIGECLMLNAVREVFMGRRLPWVLLLGLGGCMHGADESAQVSRNPFVGLQPTQAIPLNPNTASPATEEASLRVVKIGQKLLVSNPQMGLKAFFSTIGTSESNKPTEEIFHSGFNQVVITEPLVRRCKTEGELAALLSMELAKMVVECEQSLGSAGQVDDKGPPVDAPVGNDGRGSFGPADGTRAAELAKYDKAHRRGPYWASADPRGLAKDYLLKAGYEEGDMTAAAPLFRLAEDNAKLEKQMKR